MFNNTTIALFFYNNNTYNTTLNFIQKKSKIQLQ